MSGLLISEDDVAEIDASVARRDLAGGPGFFDNAFGAAMSGFGRAAMRVPLAGDDIAAQAPIRPGLGELSVLRQADEENVSISEIAKRRYDAVDEKMAADFERYRALGPDPRTTGLAGQILNSLTDYGSQAVVGSVFGSAPGAMLTMGGLERAPARIELTEEGVAPDVATQVATEQALFVGAMGGAPAAAPGKLVTRLLSGAAINTTLGAAQRGRAEQVLRENGYGDAAERYKMLDGQSLAVDAILGAGFGWLHAPGSPRVAPEILDAALTARDAELRDTRSPLGMPLNNAADRAVAEADLRAQEQIANGDPIDVADIFDMGQPATLDDLDANAIPWEAPEEIVQQFLGWQQDPAPEAPMSLMEFVKAKGGLINKVWSEGEMKRENNAGEIASLGQYPGLINNRKGMHPDDMARAAWEAGYLREWSIDDMFAVLREETVGNKTYPEEEGQYANAEQSYSEFTKEAARLGIRKNTPEARIRELLAQSEYADRRQNARPDFAPVDPHAAARDENIAALEDALAELRDLDMGEGTFDADNWLGDVKAARRESQSRVRDYILDRAAGLDDAQIAADYDVTESGVKSQVSKVRTTIERRLAANEATLEQVAAELRVTTDVVESLLQRKRSGRAPEVSIAIQRLSRKQVDGSYLNNEQIAARLRQSGHESATANSVAAQKSQLRAKGVDIPKLSTAKGNRLSRGTAPLIPTPRDDLTQALRASFGRSTEKLLDTGRVEVLSTVEELNAVTGRKWADNLKAIYSSGLDKTFVVAENVGVDEARSIMLHEVGVHNGIERMLGTAGLARLNVAIDKLLASKHPAVIDARAKAEAFSLKPEHVAEETIAYLVENHPDLPPIRRLLAQIRQWLWRAFPDLVDLTPADIQAMAVASLRRAANEGQRSGVVDWFTSFGGGLDTREGRQAWANSSAVKKFGRPKSQALRRAGLPEPESAGYSFEHQGDRIRVYFDQRDIKVFGVSWDFGSVRDRGAVFDDPDIRSKNGLGRTPQEAFGKIIAIMERFIQDSDARGVEFSGLTDAHTRLYSRMLTALVPDGWRIWEVSGEVSRKHDFLVAREDFDPKDVFPQSRPLDKPISKADIAAKVNRAKDFGVQSYLEWFRESGGMDNAGNYIDDMRASRGGKKTRDPNTKDMFDPVKAAIADDPDMMIPDNQGKERPVEDVMMRADEEVKASRELAKGFEAAGACAARHAASMITQGELRAAELTAGFAAGAAIAGVGANASIPALQDMNDQEAAAELQARADADQQRSRQEREQFKQENPVLAMPIGRSLGNTAFHVSNLTGVPEDFINALVKKESGGNVTAKAETSSATGATQFIDATWAAELTRVGDKLGFRGDPKSEEAKALRNDPRWAMAVGAEYAKANAEDLKRALGRDPTHGEVYLAHFLGPQGAIDLIEAGERDEPNAAKLFPKAAAANQNVFHGSAKTVIARQTKGFSDQPFVVNQ